MKYIVQARDFVEIRQWKSPRNGYVSSVTHTPWKTMGRYETIVEAEEWMMHYFRQAGLRQVRVKFGNDVKRAML